MIIKKRVKINKKAMLSLEELIQLLVVIAVVTFVVWFIFKLIDPGEAVDGKKNLNIMGEQMNLFAKKTNNFEYTRMSLMFDTDSLIVGFAKMTPQKPESCNDNDCICLFKDKNEFDARNEILCKIIENPTSNQIFFVQTRNSGGTGQNPGIPMGNEPYPDSLKEVYYENLYLHFALVEKTSQKLLTQFYIEKYVNDGKMLFFIAKIDDTGVSEATMFDRINKLSPCPAGSAKECEEKMRNSVVSEGFCSYNLNTQLCELSNAKICATNQKVEKDCLCGSNIAKTDLYCFNAGNYYSILDKGCDELKICDSYCDMIGKQDGICSQEEKELCALNVCNIKDTKCKIFNQEIVSNSPNAQSSLTNTKMKEVCKPY